MSGFNKSSKESFGALSLNYFNAVLVPPNDLAKELVAYAQNHFATIADGYCLSDTVCPHITLCQFEAEEIPHIDIANEFIKPIYVLSTDIRKGTDIHEGYYWLSLIVEKEDWLVDLQKSVYSQLEKLGCSVKTQTGDLYNPHVTFCRTKENIEFNKDVIGFIKETKGWSFEIGQSDENGQYLK